MPPKRTYRRKKKAGPKRKKYFRGRRRFAKTSYKGRTVKVHSALPLPNKFTVKHRYIEDSVSLDPTGLVPIVYSFRANSLFDPNLTGTGHQPMGFDNIIPFYNHYTVIGSKLKVSFINGDTAGPPNIVGIYMNGESSPTLTNWQTLAEQGNLTYSYLTQANGAQTPAQLTSLTSKFSARKFFGRRGIITEDDFRGTATTNPSEQAYFHVFVAPADNTTNNGPVRIIAEIEYIAVYTELKQLAQS